VAAYYNEIDPHCAQWLRNLIDEGHIAPGEVDERDIRDVTPEELVEFTQCHFFAGIGVWSYALRRAGWPDERPVWTGSCPCQPFSSAGRKAGVTDERHLWPHWHHLIRECEPPEVFGEQVASKDGRAWFDLVQADLEGVDYACAGFDLCAAGFGAPHMRQRLYFAAKRLVNADDSGSQGHGRHGDNGDEPGRDAAVASGPARQAGANGGEHQPGPVKGFWGDADWLGCRDGKWRPVEPGSFPLADGAAARVGRLRAYGNAIVAPQAQGFIEAYLETEG
jgi:DNA (cytosine-5)-methyltransferase 1